MTNVFEEIVINNLFIEQPLSLQEALQLSVHINDNFAYDYIVVCYKPHKLLTCALF